MRLPICAVLLVSVIACPHAQGHDVFGPQINLRIEAPVYTHMPVWLDVDVQDACLEARYPSMRTRPTLAFAETMRRSS